MALDLDWKVLGSECKDLLKELLSETVTGAVDDLENFAKEIMSDMVAILQIPNDLVRAAASKELLGQLKALAEKNRLKAINNAWDKAQKIVAVALNMLLVGIKAAI